MSEPLRRTLLTWLLRIAGVSLLFAWPAVFLTTEFMASTHARAGLGTFPDSPLVQYLTRSIAALYGIHGGVFLVASRDLDRFRPLIVYLGAMNVVFGALMVGIDQHAGMPWWWTFGEGPGILGMGVGLLALVSGIRPKG